MHHEILTVASAIDAIDVARLRTDLRAGTYRKHVFDDFEAAATDAVAVSPHLFLPDGSNYPNPGIGVRWQGDWVKGFPVIERDEPAVIDELLARSVA